MDRLKRLNSSDQPGLSEAVFRGLFAKCRCGLIMTRRVFTGHSCAPSVPVIIDLTSDDSDDAVDVVPGPIVIDLTGDSDDDLQ